MKVVKFGGSSLASASQLEKVLNIVKSDPERRFVVVSAPGKRDSEDTKVTDALINTTVTMLLEMILVKVKTGLSNAMLPWSVN